MIAIYILALVLGRQLSPKLLTHLASLLFKLLYTKELKSLDDLKLDLKQQEKDLSSIFIMDEFARHARLSRKVNKLSSDIETAKRAISNKKYFFTSVVSWTGKFLFAAVSLYVFVQYRYTPVLKLPKDMFYFSFLWNLVSFPNLVAGNVSCVFWALSCQIFLGILEKSFNKISAVQQPSEVS